MKNYDYDKITDEIFCRAEAARAEQKRKKRALVGAATPLCLLALTVSVCLPAMLSRDYTVGDAMIDGENVNLSAAEMEIASSDENDMYFVQIDDAQDEESEKYVISYKNSIIVYGNSAADSMISCIRVEDENTSRELYMLAKMINESDHVVMASVEDAQDTDKKNKTAYTMRVVTSYKGELEENDSFDVTMHSEKYYKIGENMICFLKQEDGEYTLIAKGLSSECDEEGMFTLEQLKEEIEKNERADE